MKNDTVVNKNSKLLHRMLNGAILFMCSVPFFSFSIGLPLHKVIQLSLYGIVVHPNIADYSFYMDICTIIGSIFIMISLWIIIPPSLCYMLNSRQNDRDLRIEYCRRNSLNPEKFNPDDIPFL
jgi:hypothetical protein